MTPPDPTGAPGPVRDATEHLLGQARVLKRREVSTAAGVPLLQARRFWHALGFPGVGDEESSFTDADVEALAQIVELIRRGLLDETLALSMTRAIARTTDRLAVWQSSLLLDGALNQDGAGEAPVGDLAHLVHHTMSSGTAGRGIDGAEASRLAAERLLAVADHLEPLLVYAWRRHLAAAVNRLFSVAEDESGGSRQTVGFADMVGFTTLVTKLSDRQLGVLVAKFEELVADVVTARGGRVVKTIGDEVFYTADCAPDAVRIALDLLEVIAEDPSMPRMRVGLATGDVLEHLGDLFGTTVNRASRISEVAQPGLVLVDEATAETLAGRSEFGLVRLEPQHLRGLGATPMWSVARSWSSPTASPPTRRVERAPWSSAGFVVENPSSEPSQKNGAS